MAEELEADLTPTLWRRNPKRSQRMTWSGSGPGLFRETPQDAPPVCGDASFIDKKTGVCILCPWRWEDTSCCPKKKSWRAGDSWLWMNSAAVDGIRSAPRSSSGESIREGAWRERPGRSTGMYTGIKKLTVPILLSGISGNQPDARGLKTQKTAAPFVVSCRNYHHMQETVPGRKT